MPASSKVPPDFPGPALRVLREEARLSIREVSARLGWSSSKLSRIETSSSSIKLDDLHQLLDVYEAPDSVRSKIGNLTRHGTRRVRASPDALPGVLERYVRLEAQASEISVYAALVVPGLLQTQEYASKIIGTTPTPEEQFRKARMETRMVRQAILGRDPPIRLSVVIDEAVVRRPVGDWEIMGRQMMRLRELQRQTHTAIRLLPFAKGAHPALNGPFTILNFPDDLGIPPTVFCDGLTGGVLRESASDVTRYRDCFAALDELSQDFDPIAWLPEAVQTELRRTFLGKAAAVG